MTSLDAKRAELEPAAHRALAQDAILVLGSSRSGTTWLAKILDSHPDVIYRHEPDEYLPPVPGRDSRAQIQAWIDARELRIATKRPFFQKSWQSLPLAMLRQTLAATLSGVSRLPIGGPALAPALARVRVPDFAARGCRSPIRAVLKLVNWDGTAALRDLPEARCIFILRHPCGQISSIRAGAAQRHLKPRDGQSDVLFDVAAVESFAGSHGVPPDEFRALPLIARYAWDWVLFNFQMVKTLRQHVNARIVLYEDLCARPEMVVRELFRFAGLTWNKQTEGFIASSTGHAGGSGYFDVYRSSAASAERWRQTMSPEDQDQVRSVVRRFPIARHWPDLLD